MNRTKIVCTIGPSSESPEALRELIKSGMNVARLNFSHGDHAEHQAKIERIRDIADELKTPVAILQDLCGPKIRTGKVKEPGIQLVPGEECILTKEDILGEGNRVSVSYKLLPEEVKPGDPILLADGIMDMVVKSTDGTDVVCEVVTGGLLTSNKGINLPESALSVPAMTEKDKEDLVFGLSQDVDYVALSFVRRGEDIDQIKALIAAREKDTPVVAKIEMQEAIVNIDEIIEKTDGIMVARGDLGVEVPLEKVPGYQKMLVEKSIKAGKPVIIATQMLRSMVDSPRPTRAEAADVANAVLDGADAVMLSEETANGNHPIAAVSYMRKIADSAEENFPYTKFNANPDAEDSATVSYAACVMAANMNAAAIVAPTSSGFTARQISRFRPASQIIALSPDKRAIRKLCLHWGCVPSLICDPKDTDEMLEKGASAALVSGHVKQGDTIIITAGHPVWVSGTTNMLKVKHL